MTKRGFLVYNIYNRILKKGKDGKKIRKTRFFRELTVGASQYGLWNIAPPRASERTALSLVDSDGIPRYREVLQRHKWVNGVYQTEWYRGEFFVSLCVFLRVVAKGRRDDFFIF